MTSTAIYSYAFIIIVNAAAIVIYTRAGNGVKHETVLWHWFIFIDDPI